MDVLWQDSKIAHFIIANAVELIARKIWTLEKFLIFHTVMGAILRVYLSLNR